MSKHLCCTCLWWNSQKTEWQIRICTDTRCSVLGGHPPMRQLHKIIDQNHLSEVTVRPNVSPIKSKKYSWFQTRTHQLHLIALKLPTQWTMFTYCSFPPTNLLTPLGKSSFESVSPENLGWFIFLKISNSFRSSSWKSCSSSSCDLQGIKRISSC